MTLVGRREVRMLPDGCFAPPSWLNGIRYVICWIIPYGILWAINWWVHDNRTNR